jgi:hypothetical protein
MRPEFLRTSSSLSYVRAERQLRSPAGSRAPKRSEVPTLLGDARALRSDQGARGAQPGGYALGVEGRPHRRSRPALVTEALTDRAAVARAG